jgi:hypothetical protein
MATEPAPAPASPPLPPKVEPLAANMRAALSSEPDDDEGPPEVSRLAGDDRPARPDGLFFRSSPEEITVSAPGTQPEMARTTRPADEHDLEAIEQTFAPGIGTDELLRTSEGAALNFLDSTLSRPPKLSDRPSSVSDAGETPAAAMALDRSENGEDFDEEVIIADDLAEMIDAEDEAGPSTEETPEQEKAKRSVPPPIPRQ